MSETDPATLETGHILRDWNARDYLDCYYGSPSVPLLLAWLVFTPAAFLVALRFGGGPVGAMLCMVGYLGLLSSALAWRFRSGAWKRIELIEPVLL